jgi:nucleotide-binding universal stress UspA family protein
MPPTDTPSPQTAPASHPAVKHPHFLVPIDFSAQSASTVAPALEAARPVGARVTLLHVVEVQRTTLNPGLLGAVRLQDNLEAMREDARTTLTAFGDTVRAAGLMCAEEVRQGIPAEEILKAAQETAPDLIVIGHMGSSALSRFLMGSTAERVVRHAHCSVVTVRA